MLTGDELIRQHALTSHLSMPEVYSIDGSTTLPFTIGLEISNAARDIAHTKNKVASASCAPNTDDYMN